MRLIDFSENPQTHSKSSKNQKKWKTLKQKQISILQSNDGISKRNRSSWQKINQKSTTSSSNSIKLIFQRNKKSELSSIETMGIILLKIISHQIYEIGYSPLKMTILKSLNDLEKQNIIEEFLKQFKFKTSSHELRTIFNCTMKMVSKKLIFENISEIYIFQVKNRREYEKTCLKIHEIVMNHFNQFPVCLNFFSVFLRMILMLIKYPRQKLNESNYDSKETFFIICDYLGIKLQENSSFFILEKNHFIEQMETQIQFGLIKKQFKKQKNKKIHTEQNQQTRSTIDLHSKEGLSVIYKTQYNSKPWKFKTLNNPLSSSNPLVKQLKIQKCVSRLKLKKVKDQKVQNCGKIENSFESKIPKKREQKWQDKSNKSITAVFAQKLKSLNRDFNTKNNEKKNLNKIFYKQWTKKDKNIVFQCSKCFRNKQLSLDRNVIEFQVYNTVKDQQLI